jgi:plastocyanin/uncharacterized membrane protein YozB (DUF420 family)
MTPNINLLVQLSMGLALLLGTVLARKKQFRAHGICQSAVVLFNLIPIALFMRPSFHRVVMPALPAGVHDRFYAVATIHATLGTIAEVLGIYIILSAGLKLLPPALRFTNYKRWMRTELALWWLVIAFGLSTYYVWNVAANAPPTQPTSTPPPITGSQTARTTSPAPSSAAGPIAKTVTVNIGNFAFAPKDLQVDKGTVVIWKNTAGRHTVTADDNSFESPIMAPGEEFKFTFERPGRIQYFCNLHGAAGGHDMSGTVTVK